MKNDSIIRKKDDKSCSPHNGGLVSISSFWKLIAGLKNDISLEIMPRRVWITSLGKRERRSSVGSRRAFVSALVTDLADSSGGLKS